jgi:hypothetical protein
MFVRLVSSPAAASVAPSVFHLWILTFWGCTIKLTRDSRRRDIAAVQGCELLSFYRKGALEIRRETSHVSLNTYRIQKIGKSGRRSHISKTEMSETLGRCQPSTTDDLTTLQHKCIHFNVWQQTSCHTPRCRTGLANMRPLKKYLRPSATWIISVTQFNKHNVIGLQNTIWQI